VRVFLVVSPVLWLEKIGSIIHHGLTVYKNRAAMATAAA
jgi:hypothetical protein